MARQPATLPSHAIFPKRRAVPPVSWPLQRHDWQALIFTVCITAIFLQWRHLILLNRRAAGGRDAATGGGLQA
jgi:hypothetical protein